MNRDNWFLVLPTIVLGVIASHTLYQMHAAGDVRRSVAVVAEYEAAGRPTLGDYLARRGPLEWDSTVVSRLYGTMDVTCKVGRAGVQRYVWRVDLLQQAFAPADAATRELMGEYEPALYSRQNGSSP